MTGERTTDESDRIETTEEDAGDDHPTVLVVEDEPDLAQLFAAHLSDRYRVRTALSGAEALDVLDDDDVDVMLLDRKMPGMSGDEVLEAVTGREDGCQVAMITAVTPETDIVDFQVADYLVKPVRGPELRRTVAYLLAMATHESTVREFVELSIKQVTLEREHDPSELHDNPEYRRLDDRLTELATSLGDLSEELPEPDFELFMQGLVNRMQPTDPDRSGQQQG